MDEDEESECKELRAKIHKLPNNLKKIMLLAGNMTKKKEKKGKKKKKKKVDSPVVSLVKEENLDMIYNSVSMYWNGQQDKFSPRDD